MHEATIRLIKETMKSRWVGAEPDIESDHELEEDLGLDVIDRSELAIEVDQEFDCDISDEEIAGWNLVSDVDATIERLAAEAEVE